MGSSFGQKASLKARNWGHVSQNTCGKWPWYCTDDGVNTEDTLILLNDLTETCKDGELGYRAAAESVRNTQVESILGDYAQQRAGFARQLQAEAQRMGGTSTRSGCNTARR